MPDLDQIRDQLARTRGTAPSSASTRRMDGAVIRFVRATRETAKRRERGRPPRRSGSAPVR